MINLPASSRRVVIDTSALISLAHSSFLDLILEEFRVVISNFVIEELKKTSRFGDVDGKAAVTVLKQIGRLEIRTVDPAAVKKIVTSRLNEGEASCVLLAQAADVDALISDDLKAMHQLQQYAQIHKFDLGLAAVLIQALVLRGKLSKDQALESLEWIAEKRDWMGRPIYKAYQRIVASTFERKK